ncbi:MAG: hypothetical protein AUJ28_02345 [Parcubacteria group bacterium CG1_02_37_51]|uniref:Uncharacterized protein n=2 Tax=Candidatus Komeiliibacteriota TaxID=1817908 RepID=A0A2M8DRN1_9BACT|nr:MAG: hypothetical protein AUJ28_02345 [Parcubacteria group bacterium CG1_02_37_51]PIY95078.1 MAG: hypothetical protein COY67_01510 [Candidatus Komeilibacteria bacterium CG_4_10_14_0_8_um_filter_37_78]PJC02032.1 MAG: hypothetical protein CO073_01605 [Candidatus Komeilibacteria bacterium CG_4_9_14_0_8_um_filter_36_9]
MVWANHERQGAQARAFSKKDKEYILLIKVDEIVLDDIPPKIDYVSLKKGIEKSTSFRLIN